MPEKHPAAFFLFPFHFFRSYFTFFLHFMAPIKMTCATSLLQTPSFHPTMEFVLQPVEPLHLRKVQKATDAKQIQDRPPEVNVVDHIIGLNNGSTVALEASKNRLSLSKQNPPPDLRTRLEEVTRQNGFLRMEVQFYRTCFTAARRLKNRVADLSQQLQVAYYQDGVYREVTLEEIHKLNSEIIRAMLQFEDEQAAAEDDWLAFWGASAEDHEAVAKI